MSRRADSPGRWGTTDPSKIIPSITRGCDCCSFSVLSRGHRLSQVTTPNSQASSRPGLRKRFTEPRKEGRNNHSYSHQIITKLVSPESLPAVLINSGVRFFPQGCEKSMRFVLQTDHYDRESSAMKLI